jgi:hypothetical protein
MTAAATSPAPDAACKGCRVSVRLAPGEVDRLVAEALAATPQPLASPEVAAARLAVCRTCPDLQYGTTCRHCGCLVEVRVRLSAKDCAGPVPRW